MKSRQRLSASIDASLLSEAMKSVARGRASNLSAWVNDAIRQKLEHDRRLEALADFIGGYEKKHGVISPEEIDDASRWARRHAVIVRGRRRRSSA